MLVPPVPSEEAEVAKLQRALGPARPVRSYERALPGELTHIDIRKLNRFREPGHRVTGDGGGGRSIGAGWEFAHACIDDAPRAPAFADEAQFKDLASGNFHLPLMRDSSGR